MKTVCFGRDSNVTSNLSVDNVSGIRQKFDEFAATNIPGEF